MDKIEQIEQAIKNAVLRTSKVNQMSMDVPALASLRIRHLLNNLGAIATNYLEVGVHKGGTFCSTVCENELLTATAIDSFKSDEPYHSDQAEPQFIENSAKLLHPNTKFKLIIGDSFRINLNEILAKADLYLYDAGHSKEDQMNALLYYKNALADEFIYCCDDWTYGDVKEGTLKGIKDGGYEILFEKELLNSSLSDEHLNEEWWRGYYVALLKNKQ